LSTIEEIRRHGAISGGGWFGLSYISLFMLFDLFFHLDFGNMALSVVEFGLEAYKGLSDFAGSMGLSRFLFASTILLVYRMRGSVFSTFVHGNRDVDHDVGLTL